MVATSPLPPRGGQPLCHHRVPAQFEDTKAWKVASVWEVLMETGDRLAACSAQSYPPRSISPEHPQTLHTSCLFQSLFTSTVTSQDHECSPVGAGPGAWT